MIKNLLFLMVTLLISFGTYAQTEKGDWLVGGSFSLNTTRNTTISFTPDAGYFIVSNLALGASVNLSYVTTGEIKSTVLGIGPFLRYYIGKANIRPFILTEYAFTSTKVKIADISNTENGGDFFLGLGLAAFINENVAIEPIAGYVHSKVKDQDGDSGFAMRIGFQVYLRPKKVVEAMRSKN